MSRLEKGYTLMHEHMTIDLSGIKEDLDCHLNCFEQTVDELKQLYDYGVRCIVDVTNQGMGRNVGYVQQVQDLTGIQIIQSTGFYKTPFLPEIVVKSTISQLAQMMIEEIITGIEESGIPAKLIGEIGTSKNMMYPLEQKVFDAAIIASLQTDTPISTHTTLGTYGLEQAEYLLERGIPANKIIIGHQDLSSWENLLTVLKTGVYVGFDTIGKEKYARDELRQDWLLALEQLGLLSQVVLSMDITRKSQLINQGGIGYQHLFTSFLPRLRKAGLKESSIDQMLVINPQQILG